MSFIAPDHGDRGEPGVNLGRTGGSAVGEQRQIVPDGAQVLARGALACPDCSLPISPAPRIRPRQPLSCAYCDHAAPAIEFMRENVADTVGNDVILVARFA